MTSLERQQLFLSASFPSGERGRRFEPFDPGGIADAVTSVVRAVLTKEGRLLFGGHPTITPLVLMVASELGRKEGIDVYQSRWFEGQITEETHALADAGYGQIHWTPKRGSLTDSLHVMRQAMLGHDQQLIAGIFIGGMEGIIDEYELFRSFQPGVPRISFLGPGGAAATLPVDEAREVIGSHVTSRRYPFVASLIADRLAARGQERAHRRPE